MPIGNKSNVEFDGIPTNVNQDNLKGTVVKLINSVLDEEDDKVTENDIEACHRLYSKKKDKPPATIIRAKRNVLDKVKKNKKNLKNIFAKC